MKNKLHFQRFEIKYQIPPELIQGLVPEFLKYTDVDPYAKNLPDGAYTISSLYYDSQGLDCYYQKLAGVKKRKKLRIRFYDAQLTPQSLVFLEIKRKHDFIILKDRLALTLENCYDVLYKNQIPKNLNPDDKKTLDEFLWTKFYNGMYPQNMVIYQRKPLISKVDPDFRVTLDYNLHSFRSSWLTDRSVPLKVNPETAILEVKFNNILPAWFHQIIQRYSLSHMPFSKYCNSLEVCMPGLKH